MNSADATPKIYATSMQIVIALNMFNSRWSDDEFLVNVPSIFDLYKGCGLIILRLIVFSCLFYHLFIVDLVPDIVIVVVALVLVLIAADADFVIYVIFIIRCYYLFSFIYCCCPISSISSYNMEYSYILVNT